MNAKTMPKALPLLILISLVFAATADAQSEPFTPRTVIRKPFRAIVDAPLMNAVDAQKTLHANELVLGVVVGDKARAYPINMLTGPSREVINDNLGETAIAATW